MPPGVYPGPRTAVVRCGLLPPAAPGPEAYGQDTQADLLGNMSHMDDFD